MKIKALRNGSSRVSKTSGNDVWDYEVTGVKPAEKVLYKKIMGSMYRENEAGNPLWFSNKFVGHQASLEFSADKSYVYCPEVGQRKAIISQARSQGINVDKAFEGVLASMFTGFTRSTDNEVEETDNQAEATPKRTLKSTSKSLASGRKIGKM